MKKAFLFIVLFGCYASTAFSQQAKTAGETSDTLNFYVAKSDQKLKFKTLNIGDINGFHHYRTFGSNRLPFARSGNLGLAAHSLELGEIDWSINSLLGAYQIYTLTEDSMRYYNVSRPLTELSYVNGSKTEQFFRVFHTQNLGDGLNISFKYERMTSEGYFLRQLTNHTRFHFNYNLHSRNRRFKSKGFYLINNFKSQENGGIFLSENNKADNNTVLLDINLYDAQNRGRSQEVGFENQFAIFQKDSANNRLNLIHKLTYKRSYRNYQHDLTNSNMAFYANAYFDTTYTRDSSYADDFSNYLGLSFLKDRLTFGAQHHLYQYFQNNLIDKNLSSVYLKAVYEDTLFKQGVLLDFEKGMSGYHRDELDFSGRISLQKIGTTQLNFKVGMSQKQADYFLENYRSNQYFYKNSFKTVNTKSAGVEINEQWSGVNVEIAAKQIENYIYFDSLSIVQQFDEAIEVVSVKLNKKFSFFNGRLNLFNRIGFQQFSVKDKLPLPELFSYHSLYFKIAYFNHSLQVEAGIDLYYIGEYEGYAY